MNLIHTCPKCGLEYERDCTPEPDQLCPVCFEEDELVSVKSSFTFTMKNMQLRVRDGTTGREGWVRAVDIIDTLEALMIETLAEQKKKRKKK